MLSPTVTPKPRAGAPRLPPAAAPAAGRRTAWAPRLVLLLALAAAGGVGLDQLSLPHVVPADAPAVRFSAERAVRHLEVIARAPRSVGSPGHTATRAYLIEQIRGLGLEPEVQATTSVLRFPGSPSFDAGSVQNVLVRLPGTASTGAIALNAHYDGGLSGPAAGDCGACVVTLLETLRALRAGPPLRNDVIFVFSDAEEVGDLGAHAFATQHPWMRDVRLALNFESQGAGGPALLYATSDGNRRLIEEFARSAPHALTSSFAAGLIALVPEQRLACDLQDYLNEGSAGLGFFFSGNTPAYHTVLDNPDVLDTRTVQHTGSYALALATHFGSVGLATIEDPEDAVFFNLARGWVAHYPVSWAIPLALVGLLLTLGLVAAGIRSGRVSALRVLLAAVAFPVSVVLSLALVTLVWWAIRTANPNLQVVLVGSYGTGWYLAGLLALGAAGMAAAFLVLRSFLSRESLASGAVLAFAELATLMAAVFPPGSYIVLWPLLASLPALAWMLIARRPAQRRRWRLAVAVLAVVPSVIVLLPAGLVGFSALMVRLDSLTSLPVLGVTALFVMLLAGLLLPFGAWALGGTEEPTPGRGGWLLPGTVAALALLLIAVGTARSRFDAGHPRPNQVMYELDADRGVAQWVTGDARLDGWTVQFIPASTPRNPEAPRGVSHGVPTYAAAAPLLPVAAPEVRVLGETWENGVRTLRFRVRSPRGAPLLKVEVTAPGPLLGATVAGQALELEGYTPAAQGSLALMYAAPPPAGVGLTLRIRGTGTVRVELADWSTDLPFVPGVSFAPRPPGIMAVPYGNYEGTRVRRSFEIEG